MHNEKNCCRHLHHRFLKSNTNLAELEVVLFLGYKKHKEIMENRRFWCNVLSLLDDDESFVRAKTVTLLGHVYVSDCLWKIFCEENHHSKVKLKFSQLI